MPNSPSALPAFSFNWVGGDIRGLSRLAGELYGFAGKGVEPETVLKNTVERLVGESGQSTYTGSAADRFRRSVKPTVTDIGWLSSKANSIGSVVDGLAVRLAKIEAWLEGQAERGAAAKLIAIDGAGKITLPEGSADPQVQRFLQQLNQSQAEAKAAAESARRAAAAKLEPEYKSLLAGIQNYANNHKDLLSANEIKAIGSSVQALGTSFSAAESKLHDDVKLHWGAAIDGAWKGAAEVSSFCGIWGIETGPFDIGIGAVGGIIGGTGGFFKGLFTGHALFEK
jgi:hypothetical protein